MIPHLLLIGYMIISAAISPESRIDDYLWNRIQHWPLATWLIEAVEAHPDLFNRARIRADGSTDGDDVVIEVSKSPTQKGCATYEVTFHRLSRTEVLGPRLIGICILDDGEVMLKFEGQVST